MTCEKRQRTNVETHTKEKGSGNSMGNLKYAILGLLNQKEMTGYDLMKQFESTLCEFWSAKHSQIYPELKKLTDEGNIAYKIEPSENGFEKTLSYYRSWKNGFYGLALF